MIVDSKKVIDRMKYFMANPDRFYYVEYEGVAGDATYYMMHGRVGFGKPFFEGDTSFKAGTMIHEMSHTVFTGTDGNWDSATAPDKLRTMSQHARKTNSEDTRLQLRTNAYLYEMATMGQIK